MAALRYALLRYLLSSCQQRYEYSQVCVFNHHDKRLSHHCNNPGCGKARNNQAEMQIEGGPRTKHGGENKADNSGIISYVRIEFAGYPFAADKEINGLTSAP